MILNLEETAHISFTNALKYLNVFSVEKTEGLIAGEIKKICDGKNYYFVSNKVVKKDTQHLIQIFTGRQYSVTGQLHIHITSVGIS